MFSRTTKTIQQKLQFNLQNSLDLLPYMKFPFLNYSVLSWPLKSFLPEKCKPLIKSISSQKLPALSNTSANIINFKYPYLCIL